MVFSKIQKEFIVWIDSLKTDQFTFLDIFVKFFRIKHVAFVVPAEFRGIVQSKLNDSSNWNLCCKLGGIVYLFEAEVELLDQLSDYINVIQALQSEFLVTPYIAIPAPEFDIDFCRKDQEDEISSSLKKSLEIITSRGSSAIVTNKKPFPHAVPPPMVSLCFYVNRSLHEFVKNKFESQEDIVINLSRRTYWLSAFAIVVAVVSAIPTMQSLFSNSATSREQVQVNISNWRDTTLVRLTSPVDSKDTVKLGSSQLHSSKSNPRSNSKP